MQVPSIMDENTKMTGHNVLPNRHAYSLVPDNGDTCDASALVADQLNTNTNTSNLCVNLDITKAICEKKDCQIIHELMSRHLENEVVEPEEQLENNRCQDLCVHISEPICLKYFLCCMLPENILPAERYWISNDVLCRAIEEDHHDLVDYILSGHLFINEVSFATISRFHPSPIIVSMRKSNLDVISRLVTDHKANVDGTGSTNWFLDSAAEKHEYGDMHPIELAFQMDNSNILELLLRYSKSKDKVQSLWAAGKFSLLHLACFHGAFNCVKLLLESDLAIDVNSPNNFPDYWDFGIPRITPLHKYTPLMVAAGSSSKIVQLLLDKGAAVTPVEGRTPLHGAFQFWGYNHIQFPKDLPDIVALLIQAGVDLTVEDNVGQTSLECLFSHMIHVRWNLHRHGDKIEPLFAENILLSVRKLVEYNKKLARKLYLNGDEINNTIHCFLDHKGMPAELDKTLRHSGGTGGNMYYVVGIAADMQLVYQIAELLFSGNVCVTTNICSFFYKSTLHQLSAEVYDMLSGIYNSGTSFSMTDGLLYILQLDNTYSKLNSLSDTHPDIYVELMDTLKHLLVFYILNGEQLARIDIVAELLVLDFGGYKSILLTAMSILDHVTRNNFVKDLNVVLSHLCQDIGRLDSMTLYFISDYLEKLSSSWTLKSLCKSVIILCLGPKCYTKLDRLPLPSVLVSYLKFS